VNYTGSTNALAFATLYDFEYGFSAPALGPWITTTFTGTSYGGLTEYTELTITASGALTGVSASGCRFSGTLTPSTDGNYYDDDYRSETDIHRCESSGDWYHIDDMVSTRDGYVAQDHATELTHEDDDGNQWAPSDEVTTLFNGDVIHNDNVSPCHFTRAEYWDDSEHLICIAGHTTDVELLAHEGYDALLYRVGVGITADKYLRIYFGKAITTPSPDLGMSLKDYLSTGKHLSDLRGVDAEGDEVDLDDLEEDMRSHWGLDDVDDEVSDDEVDQIICSLKAKAEQQPSLTY
jgi:hypothetical protein